MHHYAIRHDAREGMEMHSEKYIIGQKRPLFELTGIFSKIDLSAWLSGLSYMLGISFIGLPTLVAAFQQGQKWVALLACLATFFICVLSLQYYIGLSLTSNEYGKPRSLVTGGPFQISRNPIYLTFIVPLASLAFLSWVAASIAIAFYIISMNLTVLRIEERDLVSIFGETYLNYAAKTRRWI
jgi:protein-S-isoprenylcysteine O-methyltransferase Ste14